MQAIWAKGLSHEMNVMLSFRYSLTPTEDTTLDLAASNLYRLFVGGELIGYGPARAAQGYSRLDSYSLARWSGQRVDIVVEVHSAHVNSYYVVDEQPFFAAELRQGGEVIASAADFTAARMTERVQRVRRFSFQRTFTESYRLADADRTPIETEAVPMNRLLPRYVSYPRLERLPAAPYAYGQAAIDPARKPWRDRAYRNIDPVRFKGFRPDELAEDAGEEAGRLTFTPTADGRADRLTAMTYQTYDFGRTLTGFFALHVSAADDTILYITFDEIITDRGVDPFRNDCCNVVKYALPAGEYDLLTFEANSCRFATVTVTEGSAAVTDFGMVTYENPDAAKFAYAYGDAELDRIVAAAVNTFAQNAVDVLTDCPSRERAGWLCDSYFSSRAEALFTGENRVERSLLENYALAPRSPYLPDGMIPMCYPGDHNDHVYIPNWAMWYILELRNYCRRTGDTAMAELSREKVYGLVDFFGHYENSDGLLENLESWVFIEWSRCNDRDFIAGVNYPSNMLWAAALDAAADLYGDVALAERGKAIRETVRRQAWNGEFFEDNAVRDADGKLTATGHTSETCQYYAFYFGVADPDSHPDLWTRLRTVFGPKRDDKSTYPAVHRSNAIVGNYLRLELLLRYGFTEQVLGECRDFFTRMADLTGTLWEHSRLTCSLNHGFASMAAVYIDACCK